MRHEVIEMIHDEPKKVTSAKQMESISSKVHHSTTDATQVGQRLANKWIKAQILPLVQEVLIDAVQ